MQVSDLNTGSMAIAMIIARKTLWVIMCVVSAMQSCVVCGPAFLRFMHALVCSHMMLQATLCGKHMISPLEKVVLVAKSLVLTCLFPLFLADRLQIRIRDKRQLNARSLYATRAWYMLGIYR